MATPKKKTAQVKKGTDAAAKDVTVKIGAFPGGKIKPYTVPAGSTYIEALREANLYTGDRSSSDQLDVRVNGTKVTNLQGSVKDGDQILLFTQVRGN